MSSGVSTRAVRHGRRPLTEEPRPMLQVRTTGAVLIALQEQSDQRGVPMATWGTWCVVSALQELQKLLGESVIAMPGYVVKQLEERKGLVDAPTRMWVRAVPVEPHESAMARVRIPETVYLEIQRLAQKLRVRRPDLGLYVLLAGMAKNTGARFDLPEQVVERIAAVYGESVQETLWGGQPLAS